MTEETGLFGEEIVPAAPVVEAPPAPAPTVETPPAPAEAKGETKDATPAPERSRDEQGRFTPKTDDEHSVPLSALLSERERRQAAEKERDGLKAAVPKPDVWADPEGYVKGVLAEQEPALMAKATETARSQFFNYTESAARTRHATDEVKYDDARAAFAEAAQNNPLMQQQLRDAPDPGEFIYSNGKTALELKAVGGDLSAYRKRIETEVTERLTREAAARETRNANIPVSLNSEPSKGAGVVGQGGFAGPTPDSELFPER